MCRKMEGEKGRLELERILGALGETVSWQQMTTQQWQHRCRADGRYSRTYISWYVNRGTVVWQGQHAKQLEKDMGQIMLGRLPLEMKSAAAFDSKRCAVHASKVPKPQAKSGAHCRRLFCSMRDEVEAALRLVGEQPSWNPCSNFQMQHRCRFAGRYDQTVLNWFSSTGRITCQGLNAAALELHIERALQGERPSGRLVMSPASQTKSTCNRNESPVRSQSTPDSKSTSIESTSVGSPRDDSDLSAMSPWVDNGDVKISSQQFNERLSVYGDAVERAAMPHPFPHRGLVGKAPMTRSMSASAIPKFTPSARSSQTRSQERAYRSRSCEP